MKRIAWLVLVTGLAWACLGSTAFGQDDVHSLTMKGRQLTPDEAARLELQLAEDPGDVDSRTILLGYYMMNQYRDREARVARCGHVLWLIRNSPRAAVLSVPEGTLDAARDPDAFHDAKTAWITHLEQNSSDLLILENAANFFQMSDRDRSRQILEKAQSLDPGNSTWPRRIGQSYRLDLHRYMRPENASEEAAKIEIARHALAAFETAYGLASECEQTGLLRYLSQAGFEANQFRSARDYSELMLNRTTGCPCPNGNNEHFGHIILGRLALREGNVEEAKSQLLAAGKTSGSPNLDTFGPNMGLARELLLRGEREVVLEYFQLCSRFWRHQDRLAEWSALVQAGLVPDFKANTYY